MEIRGLALQTLCRGYENDGRQAIAATCWLPAAERDSSCVRRSFGEGQQDRRAASAGLAAASLLKDLVVFGDATDQEGQDHLRACNQIQF